MHFHCVLFQSIYYGPNHNYNLWFSCTFSKDYNLCLLCFFEVHSFKYWQPFVLFMRKLIITVGWIESDAGLFIWLVIQLLIMNQAGSLLTMIWLFVAYTFTDIIEVIRFYSRQLISYFPEHFLTDSFLIFLSLIYFHTWWIFNLSVHN